MVLIKASPAVSKLSICNTQ